MENKKYLIGLTGQSGAGKTTVSKVFQENGYEILNADLIARNLQENGAVIDILAQEFGQQVITDEGKLNRKILANIVFSDKKELEKLNNIMFPLVTHQVIQLSEKSNKNKILLDAPQLFESGVNKMCYFTLAVTAPRETLITRIMNRDNITEEMANKRLSKQHSEEFFKENADFIINNNGSENELKKFTQHIVNSINMVISENT